MTWCVAKAMGPSSSQRLAFRLDDPEQDRIETFELKLETISRTREL